MKNLFKISAVLWIIWGVVHVLAGVLTMKGVLTDDISASIVGIADGTNPEVLIMEYHPAAGAIIGQHGFNLFWIGLVTFFSAFYIWKGSKNAILLAALVGGLADLGYFLFMDLGGHVNFVPGTVMTLVSLSAIVLSFYAMFKTKE
ncbi:MAG: hypothetical protein ACPGR7_07905 [Flavobacteriaceae bacterium]